VATLRKFHFCCAKFAEEADAPPHFVGNAGRKRIEANVIAGPAWTLEGCTFTAAVSTAGACAQFVA
jgi:hypothetical protein